MATDDDSGAPRSGPDRLRILAIVLLLAGALSYLRGIELGAPENSLPLAPLSAPPSSKRVEAIPAAPGAMRGQNLVLVTLDTTRADRLGAYGFAQAATPHLDRLAAEGVLFTRAVATTSTTLPTHASILTGLHPFRHGARANALFTLGPEQQTLAELLREAGYETGAFVSSAVLARRYGLAQGFDHYDDRASEATVSMAFTERSAEATTTSAIRWLDERGAGPFFLWIHYFDPHGPYRPPAGFEEAPTFYDGEIAYVDQQLGRLLEAVGAESRGDTLVVVTADHGEAFGAHGERDHGALVQEATIQVPLILHSEAGLDGGVAVTTRASQVDILPTVLALLGLELPVGLDGVDLSVDPPTDRAVLAESVYGYAYYGWAPLAAVYQGPLKYVHGPSPELYDLSTDPTELENLIERRPEDAERLRRRLLALRSPDVDRLPASKVELDAEELAQLQALGYLVGGPTQERVDTGGADPKEMLPLLDRLNDLLDSQDLPEPPGLLARVVDTLLGRPTIASRADLIGEIEAMLEEHPDFSPAWRFLVPLYEKEGRLDEAFAAQERWHAASAARRD